MTSRLFRYPLAPHFIVSYTIKNSLKTLSSKSCALIPVAIVNFGELVMNFEQPPYELRRFYCQLRRTRCELRLFSTLY
ncbi:hypothetical protein SAMN05421787_109119 [Virgibacillus pantothenticus]|nr:hypothetical protein SAMN05421787_109119 [Virgibacillus pantothenticus]